MFDKKYRILEEDTIELGGRTLYRIEALRDFGRVIKGTKGGYIQSEYNLSHEGNCWSYAQTFICDDAVVINDAELHDCVAVYGNSRVYGDSRLFNNARVYGYAEVGRSEVHDNAEVYGNAILCNNAKVFNTSEVFGRAQVYGVQVLGNSRVYGDVKLKYPAEIVSTEVKSSEDYIVFKNWWSSGRYFTWTRSNNMWKVGCFFGTGDELIKKAYSDSERSGREYERIVKYVEEILRDEKE